MQAFTEQLLQIQLLSATERDNLFQELKRFLEDAASLALSEKDRASLSRLITPLLRSSDESTLDQLSQILGLLARPVSCSQLTLKFQGNVEVTLFPVAFEAGGTGHFLWTAGLLLTSYLCFHPHLIKDKQVLELGSGLGLAGLCCSKLGAASVTLTDCVPPLLVNLQHSAARNNATAEVRRFHWSDDLPDLPNPRDTPGLAATGDPVHWAALKANDSAADWYGLSDSLETSDWPALPSEASFDVVVGSDLLYEADHPALLASVLRRRVRPGGRFVLICPIRKSALLTEFLRLVEGWFACVPTPIDTLGGPAWAQGLLTAALYSLQHSTAYKGGIVLLQGAWTKP